MKHKVKTFPCVYAMFTGNNRLLKRSIQK